MKKTGGSLLTLGALSSLLLAGAKVATGSVLLDRDLPPDVRAASARYDVNEKLGRAWVVVTYRHEDDAFENGGWDSEERVLVPGLAFDVARREVRLHEGAKDVVCAIRKKGFFGT